MPSLAASTTPSSPRSPSQSSANSPNRHLQLVGSSAPDCSFVRKHLRTLDGRIRLLTRRQRLSSEESEEFRSYAFLCLLERSSRLEQQFEGRSNLTTYFDSVLRTLLRDFRISRWGKWRASKQAEDLGTLAVTLERLIHRDRLPARDAVNVLAARGQAANRRALEAELWDLVARLPVRVDRRAIVDSDSLEAEFEDRSCERPNEQLRANEDLSFVERRLRRAVAALTNKQRTVLRLRYVRGLGFAEIARETGIRRETLYRLIARTQRTLRAHLTANNVDPHQALRVADSGAFSLEGVFPEPAP